MWLLGRWLAGELKLAHEFEPEPWPITGRGNRIFELGWVSKHREWAALHNYWVLRQCEQQGAWRPLRHLPCGGVTLLPAAVLRTRELEPEFYEEFFCEECVRWAPAGEFE